MKYRYTGTGFKLDRVAGESIADTLKRLRTEQALADKPPPGLMKDQVVLLHAIEDLREAADFKAAKRALITIAVMAGKAFGLDEVA